MLTRTAILALFCSFGFLSFVGTASAQTPCVVPDNGSGTATLPPAGCAYTSPSEVYLIINGLPPGATIEMAPTHDNWVCASIGTCTLPISPPTCEVAGGALGGSGNCSLSELELVVTGTGALAGFNRTLFVQMDIEADSGPRNPGDPVQSFPTELIRMQGQIFGDPDFCTFNLRAGASHGLPSPGHTILTDLGDTTFNVDSFFDVTYQIEFVGCPGSILDGLSGTTQASIRLETGVPAPTPPHPCVVPDNGSGTATLPPASCEYLPTNGVYEIIDGLPPGTTIEMDPVHKDFLCDGVAGSSVCSVSPPASCEASGGGLGGNLSCSGHAVELDIAGTGTLSGFSRTITIPLDWEFHTGPRTPGDPIQTFPTEIVALDGQIFGDPDFCILRLTAGSGFGLPSPGMTRLTDLGDSTFAVDSFFDVTYQIEFQGCPGSQLEGFSGVTTGALRIETGEFIAAPPSLPTLETPWLWLGVVLLAAAGVAGIRRADGLTG